MNAIITVLKPNNSFNPPGSAGASKVSNLSDKMRNLLFASRGAWAAHNLPLWGINL